MATRRASVRIVCDPPPPDVSFEDCQNVLANALSGIRPFVPTLHRDDRQLTPWVIGYLGTADGNIAGKKVLIPVPLVGQALGDWAFDINRRVDVFAGNLDPSDREKIIPWTDGEWRTFVIEPVEKHAEIWRKWFHGLRPTSSTHDVDEVAAEQPILVTTPRPFTGGGMVFFADRVELCGVDICSGPRSSRRRAVLDLLRLRQRERFVAYSGEKLAEQVGLRDGKNGAAGLVRDIRNRISKALLEHAHIKCGEEDVILSGGPGYRFADCISVHEGQMPLTEPAASAAARFDVPNVPKPHVPDVPDPHVLNVPDQHVPNVPDPHVPDVAVNERRIWILDQLEQGIQLRTPMVARHFGCSKKTAKRDLAALKEEGKVEFVGHARTGFYRIRGPDQAS